MAATGGCGDGPINDNCPILTDDSVQNGNGVDTYELVEELLFQELVGERAADYGQRARKDRDRLVGSRQVETFPGAAPVVGARAG